MGLAQEIDVSCVRTTLHETLHAFRFLILQAEEEIIIKLCPAVESSSYCYTANASVRGASGDHFNGEALNWEKQNGGFKCPSCDF